MIVGGLGSLKMNKAEVIIYTKEGGRQELTYEEWYTFKDFTLHRDNGPAVEFAGCRSWFINGNRHRDIGPAEEFFNGDKIWWANGLLHRIDGPAIKYSNGIDCWYIEDKRYSKKRFDKLIKEVRNMNPVIRLTDPRWWVRELKDI